MIPQILHIGPLPVNSFGLMVALALFAAIYRLGESFRLNGINPALAEKYVFTGGFIGLAGARVWYLAEHREELEGRLLEALFSSSGFTFFGGFLTSTVVVWWLARRDRLSLPAFVDSLGPTLALGYAIGRLGCQLSGDGDYGVATQTILGMSYESGVVPTLPGVLVFPTPLYETTLCMLIVFVLLKLDGVPAWRQPYRRFGAYLALIAIERFLIEFLRINPKILWGLSEAQVIAVLLLLAGSGLMLRGSGAGTS